MRIAAQAIVIEMGVARQAPGGNSNGAACGYRAMASISAKGSDSGLK